MFSGLVLPPGKANLEQLCPRRREKPCDCWPALAFHSLLVYSAPVRVDTLGGNADEAVARHLGFVRQMH